MPRKRIHPETGAELFRDVRDFKVRYGGRSRTVRVVGWYPSGKGDGILVGSDMEPIGRALADIKAEMQGVLKPGEVRAIRVRLKLSQRKAGELLGGGPRSFQKYESGAVLVSKPMTQLLKLLERDPKRLKELTGTKAA